MANVIVCYHFINQVYVLVFRATFVIMANYLSLITSSINRVIRFSVKNNWLEMLQFFTFQAIEYIPYPWLWGKSSIRSEVVILIMHVCLCFLLGPMFTDFHQEHISTL